MIFKKSQLQGNFIFSNGEQALFVGGYYETEDEAQIAQMKNIYETVDSKEVKAVEKKSEAVATKTGTISSASLAALAK